MARTFLVILLVVSIFSCNKSEEGDQQQGDGIKPEDKEKAAALTQFLQDDKLRLKQYYSEMAIDYIDTDDVVKSETDLWQYVSTWLHDDAYSFGSNGDVTIEQNALKFPADSTPTLTRHYAVKADKDGVAFDFIGHEYQDLPYRLIEFNDSTLKVSASWHGKTVISVYGTVP